MVSFDCNLFVPRMFGKGVTDGLRQKLPLPSKPLARLTRRLRITALHIPGARYVELSAGHFFNVEDLIVLRVNSPVFDGQDGNLDCPLSG